MSSTVPTAHGRRSRADRFNTAEEKFRTLMAQACDASLLSIKNHS
jgi:hypothetical protein